MIRVLILTAAVVATVDTTLAAVERAFAPQVLLACWIRSLSLSVLLLSLLVGTHGLWRLIAKRFGFEDRNSGMLADIMFGGVWLFGAYSLVQGAWIAASPIRWVVLSVLPVVAFGGHSLLRRHIGKHTGGAFLIAVVLLLIDAQVYPRLYTVTHWLLALTSHWVLAVVLVRKKYSVGRARATMIEALLAVSVAVLLLFGSALVSSKSFAWLAPVAGKWDLAQASWQSLSLRHANTGEEGRFSNIARTNSAWSWRGRSILLLTVDALRADMLTHDSMPHLARMAETSFVFSHAYTPTPNSSYALASLHLGVPVFSLVALNIAERPMTLAKSFSALGYKTHALYSDEIFSVDTATFGSIRKSQFGFDERGGGGHDADALAKAVLARFSSSEGPHFAWAHFLAPHEPYRPANARFGDSARDRYRAEVFETDAVISALVNALRTADPNLVVVLTSDHGEAFGEHQSFYHGTTLYDEQVRVPLLINFSTDNVPSTGRVINKPVSLIDLAPTMLLASGAPVDSRVMGFDLSRPEMLPNARWLAHLNGSLMGIEDGRKGICVGLSNNCEIFSLSDDPGDTKALDDSAAATRAANIISNGVADLRMRTATHPSTDTGERLLSVSLKIDCAQAEPVVSTAMNIKEPIFKRQRALRSLRNCPELARMTSRRVMSDGYMRITAAEVLGDLGDPSDLDFLRKTLEAERYEAGRLALTKAIETLGERLRR